VEAGRIKVLWIMATNPAVSMPDAAQVRRAIELSETRYCSIYATLRAVVEITSDFEIVAG